MTHLCGCSTFGPGPHDVGARHPNPVGCEHARPPATESVGQTASSLTPREWEWLRVVATGANEREAGHRMGVHPQTAKNHGQAVRRKLGVHTTIEAFAAIGWLRIP